MDSVDKRNKLDEEPFTYQATKNGKVFISWHGKRVTILAGPKAKKFVTQIGKLSSKEAQLLMARLTGNFKRGNERGA